MIILSDNNKVQPTSHTQKSEGGMRTNTNKIIIIEATVEDLVKGKKLFQWCRQFKKKIKVITLQYLLKRANVALELTFLQ